MTRNKSIKNIEEDLMRKAQSICDEFIGFTDGIRTMFLIHRTKEGAESSHNDKLKKLISTNSEDFCKNLYELLVKKRDNQNELRIYSSVNPRNMDKAIRKFKTLQLDADYLQESDKHSFYIDIQNRFISSLMSPSSSESSLFIVDVDSQVEHDQVLEAIAKAGLNGHIKKQYPTKNGWHIVMQPFNPALLGEHANKIMKDALILLAY